MACGLTTAVSAQSDRTQSTIWSYLHGLEYEVKAGLSIGGTAPMPLPREIRSIDSYNPNLSVMFGTEITKWFTDQKRTGFIFGARLETKRMTTQATVKNYGMEIFGDGGERVAGYWTGGVKTKVNNSYLTFPILFVCAPSERWRLKVGPYLSYMFNGDFSGHVYEGYLREGTPIGEKVEFKEGKIAVYDFSQHLRSFQWGLQLGASWRALNHLNVNMDLTWGLNDIFRSEFKTVNFAMYPIYLTVGVGYLF
ncbi:MAG: porin family protein [Alistipes sp.]|nr:porin family protein [Alistipes sp.]